MKWLSVFITALFIAGCFRDPKIEQILITNGTKTDATSAYSLWKMKMENQDVIELESILKRKKKIRFISPMSLMIHRDGFVSHLVVKPQNSETLNVTVQNGYFTVTTKIYKKSYYFDKNDYTRFKNIIKQEKYKCDEKRQVQNDIKFGSFSLKNGQKISFPTEQKYIKNFPTMNTDSDTPTDGAR